MAQLRMWKFQDSTTTDVGSYYNSGDTELFSSSADNTSPSATNKAKFPNYNSISLQKYFPKKVGHTLMNGGFITFTPNVKHRITMQFSFLTPAQYEIILNNYNNISYTFNM